MNPCCSKCGGPRNRQGQRYCLSCHAARMREQRRRVKQSAARDLKSISRETIDAEERHLIGEAVAALGW